MNQSETRFIFDWQKSRWDYRLPVLIAISFIRPYLLFLYFPRRLPDDHVPSSPVSASDRSGSKQTAGQEFAGLGCREQSGECQCT